MNVLSPSMPLYGTLSLFRTSFPGCYAFPCVSLGCDVSSCKPYVVLSWRCSCSKMQTSAHLKLQDSEEKVNRFHNTNTRRLRLNLNPLNLVRSIDSWPFDKTWKPGWIDSTRVNQFNGRAMYLEWIMTPSRARKSFSPYFFFFFCTDRAGYDGDRFNAVRLLRVISEDSAERASLDESSAFLIEGAHWRV